MAGQGQPVLSAEFQLHRLLSRIGDGAVRRRETIRPAFCAAGGRGLHAAVSRRDLPREYADRGLLVLSVPRCF